MNVRYDPRNLSGLYPQSLWSVTVWIRHIPINLLWLAMTSNSSNAPSNPSRRDLLSTGAAALGATLLPAGMQNVQAQSIPEKPQPIAPNTPPAGYNILFVLVDQEHFFSKWPMPVPAREAIKKKAITFTITKRHQCSAHLLDRLFIRVCTFSTLVFLITLIFYGNRTYPLR